MTRTPFLVLSLAAPVALVSLAFVPAQSFSNGPTFTSAAQVCFELETIDQGSQSGFGDFCDVSGPPPGPSTSIAPPCFAGVARPELEAVQRNDCAWIDFWTEHVGNQTPPPPPPVVDFDQFVVVAVVSGSRPVSCYGMEIARIVRGPGNSRVVHVRERVPCPGEPCLPVVTNSFHFVKVCKELLPIDLPVAFEHRLRNTPCHVEVPCTVAGG